jgi:hypothetical protein
MQPRGLHLPLVQPTGDPLYPLLRYAGALVRGFDFVASLGSSA